MADNETNEEPQQIQEVLPGEREEEEVVEPPRKRFKITSEEEENAWTLPEEMLEYVNEQFENYINEKDLKESILSLHPIPSNMRKVKKLDIFLQELMKDGKKKSELELEALYEKLQQRLFTVMGSLGRIWRSVDQLNWFYIAFHNREFNDENCFSTSVQNLLYFLLSHLISF